MDLSLEERLAITKGIIKLTDQLGSSGLVENRLRSSNRFENSTVVSYGNDWRDLLSHHNPLYVTKVELSEHT